MSTIILLRLVCAHLLADFLLQPSDWVKSKNKRKVRSPQLYLHVLVHGITTYLFLGIWDNYQLPLIVMGSHLLIDLGKTYLPRKNLYSFIADQLLHLAVITGCWLVLTEQYKPLLEEVRALLHNHEVWVYFTGYVFVLFPAGAIISIATRRWCSQLPDRHGLAEAGKWIGYSERFLILTFILLSRYDAIGFLVAAKSVFRFNDIMKDKERKEAEYFLIGTLYSITVALIAGLLLRGAIY